MSKKKINEGKHITKGHKNPNKQYKTGVVREIISGKGRYDLLSPISIKRIADIMERGSKKYSDRNWEKGIPLSRYIDAALRHLFQYLEGMRDEDHLGQSGWNIHAALHTEEMIERGLLSKELNDLPNYVLKDISPEEIQEVKKFELRLKNYKE